MLPELEAFFRDLRALRASADLSLAELAELAHFPEEVLAAAETGPAVPPNPVLVAYVRACGGPVGQWEDRWRDASAADADGFPAEVREPAAAVVEPAAAPQPDPRDPRRRHPGRRAAVAAAVAAALVAAGTAVALTRPAAHTSAAGATPRTSPTVSRHGTSQPSTPPPLPLPKHQAASAPPMTPQPPVTPVLRVTGVGCPAGQDYGVTLAAGSPGPPWTAAQGGWTGNGCDGTSVWTMNPAGKPSPSTVTWWFGALPGVSSCKLSVYVPGQNALGHAGYAVSTGSGDSLGTVTIDQADTAGQWIVLGTFPAAGSGYQIQLMPAATELTAAGPAPKGPGKPAGKPAPPGHNSAIAASAAATTCSSPPG